MHGSAKTALPRPNHGTLTNGSSCDKIDGGRGMSTPENGRSALRTVQNAKTVPRKSGVSGGFS